MLTPTSVVSLWLVQALARALLDQFSLLKISHRKMLVIPFLYLHIWRVSMPFFFLPFFVLALCLYDLAQWNSMVLLTSHVDLYCTFFSSSMFIGPYHHFHRYTSIQIFAAQNKLGGESIIQKCQLLCLSWENIFVVKNCCEIHHDTRISFLEISILSSHQWWRSSFLKRNFRTISMSEWHGLWKEIKFN